MKKILFLSLYAIVLASITVSCNLFQNNGTPNKTMDAEDAKVEIRAANQEITAKFDQMVATPAMGSLQHLANMSGAELKSAKTSKKVLSIFDFTYSNALNYFRGEKSVLKSGLFDDDDDENTMYGYFEYNFYTQDFDFIKESNSVFQLKYPADETAEYNQINNAVLTITNLEFTTIKSYEEEYNWFTETYETVETEEQIPTSANVEITIDGKKELEASYKATYNSEGLPLSVDASKEADGYKLTYSFSGSGTKYRSKVMYKYNSEELMSHDLDITYTSDMEYIEKLEGDYTVAPVKLDGWINIEAIENYNEENEENADLTYLNSQLDVVAIHTAEKAVMGHVEFKMYNDYEWGDSYPELAIVYADGTYEWLSDVVEYE
ncbi:MAG TPA: hypothetical protein PLF35_01340 [Prolixibacteraceae bacterium]|nr:hypothetical protein [Prolixibacteraceae bacterium]